jgi:hypothetical protein
MFRRTQKFMNLGFIKQKGFSTFRKEYDTFGEILVPSEKYWGA